MRVDGSCARVNCHAGLAQPPASAIPFLPLGGRLGKPSLPGTPVLTVNIHEENQRLTFADIQDRVRHVGAVGGRVAGGKLLGIGS